MTIDEQRAAVVKEARSWVGTPFHAEGRVKGVGADCATFILGVFENVGMLPHVELEHVPTDWHMHSSDTLYLKEILKYCHEVKDGKPGDIVMLTYGKQAAHGAIIIDWPTVAHASLMDRRVTLSNIQSSLPRFFGFFRPNPWREEE